jgi:D-3-phosphoglycerate dehydrogenase
MDSSSKIAVTSRSFSQNKELISELRRRYTNIKLNESGTTLSGKDLINFLLSAEKAIIGIEDLSAKNLSQLPNLKVLSKYGVGLNNIDLQYCKKAGIKLGFFPGVNKLSVAEFALTLILISLKRIHNNHSQIMSGMWPQTKGFELSGKNISILGFGNIGQMLASILAPFKCKINFYDEKIFTPKELHAFCTTSNIEVNSIAQVSLDEALHTGDIISIHLPLTSETKNIIGGDSLNQIKPSAVIVNTSRGGIVDEDALYKFLSLNKSSFAAFDVFNEEPVKHNLLFTLKNFLGTSHRSSLTIEGIRSMGMAAIKGLDDNIDIT